MTRKLASSIQLNRSTGELLIDGEPLGYHIADEPFQVTVDPSGLNVVRIPILTESYSDTIAQPKPADPDDDWLPKPNTRTP